MIKMTRSTPYQLWRGRNVKDAAWNKLVEPPLDFIEDDFFAGVALLNDGTPRGCFLTQGGEETKSSHWRCHFYIAGEQRILGRGSVLQCAKLYDYALVFFEKYRIRKSASQFNFSKLDAESDMNFEPAIGRYLADLEAYLLTRGLAVPEKIVDAEGRKEKQRARNHKRTIAGTLEAWTDKIQPHIFDIAEQNDELVKRLAAIEEKLDTLLAKEDKVSPSPLTFSPGSR